MNAHSRPVVTLALVTFALILGAMLGYVAHGSNGDSTPSPHTPHKVCWTEPASDPTHPYDEKLCRFVR